jgi:hypothetical protein
MSHTLAMPKLGLTMTEGQVAEWRRAPGEPFVAGDVLVVIETDKIANEVEAPAAGRLTAVLVETGQPVPVGAALAQWESADGETAATSAPAITNETRPALAAATGAAGTGATLASTASPAVAATPLAPGGRIIAAPYARRLARERNVSLAGVAGSGPGGRIRAADVPVQAAVPPTVATPPALPHAGNLTAAPAEHFSLADVPAAALLEWRARLPAGRGGIGSLVFYLAARVLLAQRPQALCAAGDGAALPAAVAAQGFAAWWAAMQAAAECGAPVTLRFASAGRGPLRVWAPARPGGCELALGLGSVTDGSITLALRAAAGTWSAAQAAAYLTSLHATLEDPRRVLL